MFIANNDLGTKHLFFYRKFFKEEFLARKKVLDSWYDKRTMYGKIDRNWDPIVLRSPNFLKEVQEGISALNFVSDAFVEFATIYDGFKSLDKLKKKSLLFTIDAVNGHTDVRALYSLHIENFFELFNEEYLLKNKEISFKIFNFDSYKKAFYSYCSIMSSYVPVTFSSFILSSYNTIHTSGLAIDVRLFESDNDMQKTFFTSDSNFETFRKVAAKYGFLVDKNAPWKLVTDLASRSVMKHMNRYKLTSSKSAKNDIFKVAYKKAYEEDVFLLSNVLNLGYNRFVEKQPSLTMHQLSKKGNICFKEVFRERQKIVDRASYEEYIILKAYEFRISLTDKTLHVIMKRSRRMKQKGRKQEDILSYINGFFRKKLLEQSKALS